MTNDDDIQRALNAGEHNKEVSELIKNWCGHARVEKFGGVGLVEQMSGLPIGHHAMACENASHGGIASWDLADAAVDFYDRNCAKCAQRVAVGLPNLLSLVVKRDAHVKQVEEARLAAQEKKDREQRKRTIRRREIGTRQPPTSLNILEIIEEMDRNCDERAQEKLLGMANLAPETFTPEIIEYCFNLLEERESWFSDIGLQVLYNLRADPRRLVKCAMLSLASHDSVQTACKIVQSNVKLIADANVFSAMPALVWRAEPERTTHVFHGTYVHDPAPLISIYEAHRSAVETAISTDLDSRSPYLVSVGARAIVVLAQFSDLRAEDFARSIITKLARAHILMDSRKTFSRQDDESIIRLQQALVLALKGAPETTDELVSNFIFSSKVEGEGRILKAYSSVLNPRGDWHQERGKLHPASRLALRRLINTVMTSNDYEILRIVQDAFHYMPDCVTVLARSEITTLLGSAIGLDDRIESLINTPVDTANYLAVLEQQNMRQLMYQVQQTLVQLSAQSAVGDVRATDAYLDVLRNIPETKCRMRAVLTSKLHLLMNTPTGLNAVLPDLYSAMHHSDNLVRSAAIEVVGELDRRRIGDLPVLLFETFLMHLSDPYLIVHQAAAKALERLELPLELQAQASQKIFNLVVCYSSDRTRKSFLVDCIELFLSKFLQHTQKTNAMGKYLVGLLEQIEPELFARKLPYLAHHLAPVDGFANLVIKALADKNLSEYQLEYALRALNSLPSDSITSHNTDLVEVVKAQPENMELIDSLVETLSRANSWPDICVISKIAHDSIPDTVENLTRKLYARLRLIAAEYEASISEGSFANLPALSQVWKDTDSALKQLQSKHEKFNSLFPSIPSTDWRN